MARKLAAVVISMGLLQAGSVMALGLGELSLDSFLNEPLKASVDLLNTGDLHEDQIRIRLATKEDFEKLGIERAYFLTSLSFEVSIDDSGRGRIVVSSDDPVLEPYLDFIIEARWPSGRLLREYTVLVDPPVFDESATVVSASERVSAIEEASQPAKKPQNPEASSGSRISLDKSELAPGEMPTRNYGSEAQESPLPGGRYMIRRDETLWTIAARARPQGASVHQTMLDIQRLNASAFIDGNINRIKAGYVIYLPSADDISFGDQAAALAEVRQQNTDWREGRASAPAVAAGPSLRISAEDDDSATGDEVAGGDHSVGGSAALEEGDMTALEVSEMEDRVTSMEEQVETLERIVNLKDDQIAALEAALKKAGGDPDAMDAASPAMDAAAQVMPGTEIDGEQKQAVPAVAVAEKQIKPTQKAIEASKTAESEGGIWSYLWYVLGAAVLAVLGFLFVRRRGAEEDELELEEDVAEDVFADIELSDQPLEVEATQPELEHPPEQQESKEPERSEEQEQPTDTQRDNRGYGERKHDQYASDVETGDALAEADIYVAYGRYPQAIDLLKNAVASEPNNPAFHLKLLEIYVLMEDRAAATNELSELKSISDPISVARGEDVLSGRAEASAPVAPPPGADSLPDLGDLDDEKLQADFSGLEIESGEVSADELDLSSDFDDDQFELEDDDEELVISDDDDSGYSTKLDLARAYLDMGDDDGARTILEEVAAAGSEELQAEARSLLERID